MFRKILATLATLALGAGLAVTAALPAQAEVNTNVASNWVAATGETCVKYDFADPKPTTQTYAQLVSLFGISGKTVTKVVIKAGSSNGWPQANGSVEFENQAYYTDATYKLTMPSTTWTQVGDLTTQTFSHYSGKTISHVIVCYTTPSVDPTPVSGDATVAGQTCDETDYTLVPGSITPVPTTGVVYELWNSDKTIKLIADFSANSGPLANGTYYVKVLPADSNYTVDEDDMWLERTVGAYEGTCIGDIKVAGDPYDFQQCVPNDDDELTSSWLATLTIVSSPNVQYRVYFDNGVIWTDQGVWAAGTYTAGPTGDFPYGTRIKVVAEAVGNYTLSADPFEWIFEFPEPFDCNLPDFGIVEPLVTFDQTCQAGATYTLAIDGGVAGTVLFSVNGGAPTTTLGTFAVGSPSSISIVATPAPGSGFPGEGDEALSRTFTHEFPTLEACGDLTTLALTGGDVSGMLWISAFLGLLGTALIRAGRRTARMSAVS
jgi:hypothetical protein